MNIIKYKTIIIGITLCVFLTIVLTGCAKNNSQNQVYDNTYIRKSSFLLNTITTITIYDSKDEAILEACFNIIRHYENIFSRTLNNSELFRLNQSLSRGDELQYEISQELYDIIEYGLYYSAMSNLTFDITIAPLSSLWDFTGLTPSLPSEKHINEALLLVNYKSIQLKDNNTIIFDQPSMGIDLGAIAKGYIADRIKDYLLSIGVESAMINLGGNILCVGQKPDNTPFRVGIQKPFADRNETIAIMEISDYSVVSSGIYERFFMVEDVIYHHILNPQTGYPFENDLVSVTIISKKSVDGDGLSTTVFALGLEKGMELVHSLPDTHAVFITDNYEIIFTNDFHDAINLVAD